MEGVLSDRLALLPQSIVCDRDGPTTRRGGLVAELGIRPVTLYRYAGPDDALREHGQRALDARNPTFSKNVAPRPLPQTAP